MRHLKRPRPDSWRGAFRCFPLQLQLIDVAPRSFSAELHSASAMVTLSSIALLTDDEALVEAVVAEGDELDDARLADKDPQILIRRFKALWELHRVSTSSECNVKKVSLCCDGFQGDLAAARRAASKAVHTEPASIRNGSELGRLLVSYGMPELARAVLGGSVAEMSSDLPENLMIKGLAAALTSRTPAVDLESSQNGVNPSSSDVQKAIMLQPWNLASWESLAHVSM